MGVVLLTGLPYFAINLRVTQKGKSVFILWWHITDNLIKMCYFKDNNFKKMAIIYCICFKTYTFTKCFVQNVDFQILLNKGLQKGQHILFHMDIAQYLLHLYHDSWTSLFVYWVFKIWLLGIIILSINQSNGGFFFLNHISYFDEYEYLDHLNNETLGNYHSKYSAENQRIEWMFQC